MTTADANSRSPLRIAVFASGQGSTFAALAEAGWRGEMPAEVVLLVTNRAEVPAITLAAKLNIEAAVLDEKVVGPERCDTEMLQLLCERQVSLVVLAGYLRKVGPKTLHAFSGRMLNTHPAPLPQFGGKGMFGEHVHRAVLDAGVSMSAATVHLVDAEYDTGPVVGERLVPVLPGDDVQRLRCRVQEAERALLISTVAQFADGPLDHLPKH